MPMLPDGFRWIDRYQYANGELALVCNGRHVAQLMRKVDGETWIARLILDPGIHASVVTRTCTSFEAGKAGIEQWAGLNEAALRGQLSGNGVASGV